MFNLNRAANMLNTFQANLISMKSGQESQEGIYQAPRQSDDREEKLRKSPKSKDSEENKRK